MRLDFGYFSLFGKRKYMNLLCCTTDCTSGFGGEDADVLELDAMSNGLLIQMITMVWSVKDV